MKFHRKDGSMFVENGHAKLRVAEINQLPSPNFAGRVVKVLVVQEVLKSSPTNPIEAESLFCLSFPEEKANAKKYEWHKNGKEECTVRMDLNLI